jgi:hypothetical protein
MLRIGAIAAAVMLTGAFVACGDDDDSDDSAATETTSEAADTASVTLTADDAGGEYTFELSATPTAETEEVVFDNQGQQPHALVFAKINEGYTLEEAFELEGRKGSAVTYVEGGAEPGKSQSYKLDKPLEAGSYAMLCPIGGNSPSAHWKNGQLEEFSIE